MIISRWLSVDGNTLMHKNTHSFPSLFPSWFSLVSTSYFIWRGGFYTSILTMMIITKHLFVMSTFSLGSISMKESILLEFFMALLIMLCQLVVMFHILSAIHSLYLYIQWHSIPARTSWRWSGFMKVVWFLRYFLFETGMWTNFKIVAPGLNRSHQLFTHGIPCNGFLYYRVTRSNCFWLLYVPWNQVVWFKSPSRWTTRSNTWDSAEGFYEYYRCHCQVIHMHRQDIIKPTNVNKMKSTRNL